MSHKSAERIAREALIDSLEVGDLIRLNNRARVVRAVSKGRDGKTNSIVLSIQAVSWTRKPYTTKVRCDLYLCQLELVKKGYGVGRTELELQLQKDIERVSPCSLSPFDVVGRVF